MLLVGKANEWHAATLARAGMSLPHDMPPFGLLTPVVGLKLAVLAPASVQGLWLERLIRSGPCRCIRCGSHDIAVRTIDDDMLLKTDCTFYLRENLELLPENAEKAPTLVLHGHPPLYPIG